MKLKLNACLIRYKFSLLIFIATLYFVSTTSGSEFAIGRVKYNGGGDWYADPSSLVNLQKFIREETTLQVAEKENIVSILDDDLFSYSYLYLTGHGNILFSATEASRLREYLIGGGFIHVDDNFGLDESFRKELKKVFPEKDLVEVPFYHPIYHIAYDFNSGLPKIHEHDGKPPQGLAIMDKGRIVLFYTYECDLGDGWEDTHVHNDTVEKHIAALQMGTNIVLYALAGQPEKLP
ncbi:MAG: DUF4159 domain-containing protein [Candidatus Electryonea clarkiae]|nr:DUF4159 domain-containing protein [Candidatus Electryonea clarkiae]MDP8287677.1 DUF4159 domain-containing protein [Candidatus Electryonea clarkiae]